MRRTGPSEGGPAWWILEKWRWSQLSWSFDSLHDDRRHSFRSSPGAADVAIVACPPVEAVVGVAASPPALTDDGWWEYCSIGCLSSVAEVQQAQAQLVVGGPEAGALVADVGAAVVAGQQWTLEAVEPTPLLVVDGASVGPHS